MTKKTTKKTKKTTVKKEINKTVKTDSEKKQSNIETLFEEKPLDRQKRFKINLIQFFIGLILLLFAFRYLEENPAEKASIKSGMMVIYERLVLFSKTVFSDDPALIESKYKLEKNMDDLLDTIYRSDCMTTNQIKKLEETFFELKNSSLEQFSEKKVFYFDIYQRFHENLVKDC